MLRELILKELSSKGPVTLTKEVVDGASNYVQETIDWCVSMLKPQLCEDFLSIVDDVISSLSAVRLRRFVSERDSLSDDFSRGSVDYWVLNQALFLTRRFLELSLYGLISGGRVAVRFRKYVVLGEREFPRGVTALVDVREALLLELLGCAEVLGAS